MSKGGKGARGGKGKRAKGKREAASHSVKPLKVCLLERHSGASAYGVSDPGRLEA